MSEKISLDSSDKRFNQIASKKASIYCESNIYFVTLHPLYVISVGKCSPLNCVSL